MAEKKLKKLTKRKVIRIFNLAIIQSVFDEFGYNDLPAISMAFACYIDNLNKSGRITDYCYNTISYKYRPTLKKIVLEV